MSFDAVVEVLHGHGVWNWVVNMLLLESEWLLMCEWFGVGFLSTQKLVICAYRFVNTGNFNFVKTYFIFCQFLAFKSVQKMFVPLWLKAPANVNL
jgi:hypothetical protein